MRHYPRIPSLVLAAWLGILVGCDNHEATIRRLEFSNDSLRVELARSEARITEIAAHSRGLTETVEMVASDLSGIFASAGLGSRALIPLEANSTRWVVAGTARLSIYVDALAAQRDDLRRQLNEWQSGEGVAGLQESHARTARARDSLFVLLADREAKLSESRSRRRELESLLRTHKRELQWATTLVRNVRGLRQVGR